MDSGSDGPLVLSQPMDASDSAEESRNGLALVLTVLVLFGIVLGLFLLI